MHQWKENEKCNNCDDPPFVHKNGDLRNSSKSDLLPRLEEFNTQAPTNVAVDCRILDGAAIINMIKLNKANSCVNVKVYATQCFIPRLKESIQIHVCQRML